MEQTSYSKLSQRDVDRAETDLLINLSTLTQRGLAKMIGCHESKISRTDWRFIASVLCAFGMASDISPISRAFKYALDGITKKNARRQPSVLIKYKWNFNNIQRGNYMRNKGFNPPDTHKEAKRLRFLRSIDERTQISFVKVARTELLKAEARALLPSLPKEDGYTFIPNAFLEKLLKEDISVSQFNDVLKVFRQGR